MQYVSLTRPTVISRLYLINRFVLSDVNIFYLLVIARKVGKNSSSFLLLEMAHWLCYIVQIHVRKPPPFLHHTA